MIKTTIQKNNEGFYKAFPQKMKMFSINWGMESDPKRMIENYLLSSQIKVLESVIEEIEKEKVKGFTIKATPNHQILVDVSPYYNQAIYDQINHLQSIIKELKKEL